jgi:hypothetical protein
MKNIQGIPQSEIPPTIQQLRAPKDFWLSLISKLRGPEPDARRAFDEVLREVRKLGYLKVPK